MPHGHAAFGESTPQSVFYDQGRLGRLFPTLPPFAADTPLLRDALSEFGAKGGRWTLAQLHGMGPKALRIIEEELEQHGLALA